MKRAAELLAELSRLRGEVERQASDIRVLKCAVAGFTRYERARAEAAEREVAELKQDVARLNVELVRLDCVDSRFAVEVKCSNELRAALAAEVEKGRQLLEKLENRKAAIKGKIGGGVSTYMMGLHDATHDAIVDMDTLHIASTPEAKHYEPPNQVDLPATAAKVLRDNLWELATEATPPTVAPASTPDTETT